jgi:Asp-tRNA(Asn)/Glu-tRNA(Gln) amidotransferase A subunit family amidase
MTWSIMHGPVVNVPGFKGSNGLPVGLSLIAARYHDRKALHAAEEIGKLFEKEGGWKHSLFSS